MVLLVATSLSRKELYGHKENISIFDADSGREVLLSRGQWVGLQWVKFHGATVQFLIAVARPQNDNLLYARTTLLDYTTSTSISPPSFGA